MKNNLFAVAIFFFLSGIIASHAQPAAVQQFQNYQFNQTGPTFPGLTTGTNAPELYPGENTDVGPQHILRLKPRHKYFSLLLDSQVFYTDNANFAGTADKIGSTVFVNTIQTLFLPNDVTVGDGRLTSSLGLASQWYNYDSESMNGMSFNALTVFGGVKYLYDKWVYAFDLSTTRLGNQPSYSMTYQEILPAFSIQRFIPITDSLMLTLGDQVDYHFSDQPKTTYSFTSNTNVISGDTYTEINNRLDNIINATLSWQINDKLVLQPGYRFVYTNYRYNTAQDSDRNDYLNCVGVTLSCYLTENFTLRAFFNYSARCSDDPYVAAYHETNEGVGLSFNALF